MSKYKLSDFDYKLPKDLIAQYPTNKRSHSNLMVVNRKTNQIVIDKFYNILNYIDSSYFLVRNKTKVIPARLYGNKPSGGKVEILLLEELEERCWRVLVKPGRRLKVGNRMIFGDNLLTGEIITHKEKGERVVKFSFEGEFFDILKEIGEIPLPPYIKRKTQPKDIKRYQTVFASQKGSVAAPTAGLHFTDKLLRKLKDNNIETAEINLKIGLDTFRPVTSKNIEEHKIHSEYCQIDKNEGNKINDAIGRDKKILATGTTTVRTLESFSQVRKVQTGTKRTSLYIYPGYKFKIVDALITNFHLPRSSLLMLVTAFAGYELIMKAYEIAVKKRLRFFSYGDAMLII